MPLGAIAGAVGIGGALISSDAAKDTAKAQTNAASNTNATNLQIFREQQQALAPWRASGESALNNINKLLGLSVAPSVATTTQTGGVRRIDPVTGKPSLVSSQPPAPGSPAATAPVGSAPAASSSTPDYSVFTESPGYQFGLQQGQNAITSSRAASGSLQSGDAAKALTRYGQDYAGTKFDNYLNQLFSVAGFGQAATNNTNALQSNYGNSVEQTNAQTANALGSSYATQANAWNNALGSLGGYAMNRWG